MPDRRPDRAELDALAAEYVMGCLPAEERPWFERLAEEDATVRLLIAEWQGHLEPLDLAYAAMPAPDVTRAVDRLLFARARRRRRLLILAVVVAVALVAAKMVFWTRVLGLM